MKNFLISSQNNRTLALAFPIIVGQLGQMAISWTDTLMIARVSEEALAAAGLASAMTHVFLPVGLGMLMAVGVLTACAFGARDRKAVATGLCLGIMAALVLGLGVALLMVLSVPFFPWLGQDPEVIAELKIYWLLVAASCPFLFLTLVGKTWNEALSRPWRPFWIMMAGVVLNIGLNGLWIFGYGGFPAMGLAGAGWATLVARILTAAVLFIYQGRAVGLREWAPRRVFRRVPGSWVGQMFRIGLPTSGQILAEMSAFVFASVMIGWLGAQALAAHTIAINCAATTFMVPLGISMAVTVRVGQTVGERRSEMVREIAWGALGMSAWIMAMFAVSFIWGGAWIVSWFGVNQDVAELAVVLLGVAALFQVADGLQVTAAGALRGLADVKVPLMIVLTAYWVIGLPVGWAAGFVLGGGAVGLWIGLALGLGVAAFLLGVRLNWRSRYLRAG